MALLPPATHPGERCGTRRRSPSDLPAVTPGPLDPGSARSHTTANDPGPGGGGAVRHPLVPLLAMHRREIQAQLATLVTAEIVEEHRRSPSGHHSPALAQILTFLRQAPTEGKLAAYAVVPHKQWQVVRLSGVQGVPHDMADPRRYDSEEAVAHEIFLRRLDELGLWPDRSDA